MAQTHKITSHNAAARRWSEHVSEHSNALGLDPGVFKYRSAHEIALSLKQSAEHSARRRGTPLQSAMSMLNSYVNRAGRGLNAAQRRRLEAAKAELRALFGRPSHH